MRDQITMIDRQLGRLAGLFAIAGSIGITVLLGITVVAVFWRYMLNAPIFGIEDISIVALTIVAAGAVAYGGRNDAHVSINLITYFFGRNVTRVTDLIMRGATAAICFLATYALVVKSCGIEKACITSNLSIEHRPFFYVLAVAMGFYGLHMLLQMMAGLASWQDENDPHEAKD